jgi:uroporphyrinogen decarboxylase
MKNLFQRVLDHEVVSVPPVWMMRQAGRYHSHYQALKLKNSFMDLCLQPELAAEVAMGPVEDFDFDAAILFSDILFPLKALGMPLEYTDQGPRLGYELNLENIKSLTPVEVASQEMLFQKEALQMTRHRLPQSKSLIGFVGGPWTLFVYAVEGTHSGNLLKSKTSWELWQQFSKKIVSFLIENIKLQLKGGADVVMIFDTAAGELSPGVFQSFVQPALTEIGNAFPRKIGYYSKGTTLAHFNDQWKCIPFLGQGFDHRHDLKEIFKNATGFVQGNFDQGLLHLEPTQFRNFFREYLKPFQEISPEQRRGWICGLGHGILPKTPEQNVRSFVEILRKSF